jgi:hypothetical protein
VAHYPSLTKCDELLIGTCMQWNYFGSGHGKGRWYGARVSIKQALKSKQVKPIGARLHNAYDVVNFLQGHFNQNYVGYSHACKDV